MPSCVSDDDCFVGEVCAPRAQGSGKTCEEAARDCIEDSNCPPRGDIDGVCTAGKCDYSNPASQYAYVLIRDESASEEACSTSDPGSDLLGVRLHDANGALLGWGTAGANQLGTVSGTFMNVYSSSARLNGQANGLQNSECPVVGTRFRDLNPPPYAMGCGGWVLVKFERADGTNIALENGQSVDVLEYGSNCGGSDADQYSLYACTDTLSAQGGSDSSCTVTLGSAKEGFSTSSVTALP